MSMVGRRDVSGRKKNLMFKTSVFRNINHHYHCTLASYILDDHFYYRSLAGWREMLSHTVPQQITPTLTQYK